MPAYCTVVDLLIGDIPTSAALDPAKYVQDAADEIDSKIGFIYTTPIVDAPRPVTLLLKRINAHLASGRLILAATITGEMDQLNAYGASLVADAELAIAQIAAGEIILQDVLPAPGVVLQTSIHAPMIANGDSESSVDAFYSRVVGGSTFVSGGSAYYGYQLDGDIR